MELEHSFTVPVPVDLQDLAAIIGRPRTSAMPRFLQPSDGDDEA